MSDKVDDRNRRVLEAALEIAKERGYASLTRDGIAERAIVAAGLAVGHPAARAAPDGLKNLALASLAA
jgi:AcrR family transcriptional regulator